MDRRSMVEGMDQPKGRSSRGDLTFPIGKPHIRQTVMWAALIAMVGPLLTAVGLLSWSAMEARELIQSGQWVPDDENSGLDPVNFVVFAAATCVALFAVIVSARTIRTGVGAGTGRTWGLTWFCTVILFGVARATETNVCLGRVPCVSSLGSPSISFALVNSLLLWNVGLSFAGSLGMLALWNWQLGRSE